MGSDDGFLVQALPSEALEIMGKQVQEDDNGYPTNTQVGIAKNRIAGIRYSTDGNEIEPMPDNVDIILMIIRFKRCSDCVWH
ncbi:hypothetical protein CHS0354_011197 [Potamilus streckersoni]|uniref:Uncharacterized protein n=1 Tax=Potamilus streckersoni TaxID=2493646 RepID=A0AAE0T361_9BIVA|nr:hypothetical protein CHS0354_011197 [Potamilus streckersoni]